MTRQPFFLSTFYHQIMRSAVLYMQTVVQPFPCAVTYDLVLLLQGYQQLCRPTFVQKWTRSTRGAISVWLLVLINKFQRVLGDTNLMWTVPNFTEIEKKINKMCERIFFFFRASKFKGDFYWFQLLLSLHSYTWQVTLTSQPIRLSAHFTTLIPSVSMTFVELQEVSVEHLQRTWHASRERFSSGLLDPSSFLGLAYVPILETSFPAVSFLDFSPWIPLGSCSILLVTVLLCTCKQLRCKA